MKFSHIIYILIAIYLYANSLKIIYYTDLNGIYELNKKYLGRYISKTKEIF